MAKDNVLDVVKDAALDSVVYQLRILEELRRALGNGSAEAGGGDRAIVSSPLDPRTGGAENVLFEIARLSLKHYTDWLRLSSANVERFLEAVRNPRGCAPAVASAGREFHVHMKVPRGQSMQSEPFRLHVPSGDALWVSITAPLLETEGKAPVRGTATYALVATGRQLKAGESFQVEPRADLDLRMTLDVGDEYESGKTYLGSARVMSGERLLGQLTVKVEVL